MTPMHFTRKSLLESCRSCGGGRFVRRSSPFLIALVSIAFGFVRVGTGQEYTPDHPVVKKLVDRGVKHLLGASVQPVGGGDEENASENDGENAAAEPGIRRIGYEMLRAYTVLKATDDHDHRLVKAVLPGAKKYAGLLARRSDIVTHSETIIYDAAIAAMFLTAVDPELHRASIEDVRNFLLYVQKPSGGFGYLHGPFAKNEGDVSQTQYIALAFWSMKQAKIEVDTEAVERMTRWLLKVQQSDGGWSYQFPPDPQYPATHSILAAGLSAVLVGADTIEVLRAPGAKILMAGEEEEDDGVPAAFRRIAPANDKRRGQAALTRQDILRSSGGGVNWLAKNREVKTSWYYYWMYSRERFESFLELLNGKREKSPAWYNAAVEELKNNQSDDGSWGGKGPRDQAGPTVATCFAVLFLLRNTQKTIGELKSAESVGGYGLANVADIGVKDGKIIDKSQVTSVEDALKLLEDNKAAGGEDRMLADRMVLDTDPKKKKEQLNRLARMLRNPDTRARRIAAKLLGRGDDLDFAPDLIFALSLGEKDNQVVRIAENSLRILSRQLDTVKIPREGTITTAHRVEAETYWKNWYLSIRPDYAFIK